MGDVAALVRTGDRGRACEHAGAALGAETIDVAPFLEIARLLYDGPGWPNAPPRCAMCGPAAGHPASGHARRSWKAALHASPSMRSTRSTAWRRRAGSAERLFADYDALLLPTAPFCPTLAEVAADPIGPNRRLGTFTNFVNLCDLAGYRGAGRVRRRRLAGRRHVARAGVVGGPARRDRRPAASRVLRHRRCHRLPLPPPPPPIRWRRTRPRCSASARTCPACR